MRLSVFSLWLQALLLWGVLLFTVTLAAPVEKVTSLEVRANFGEAPVLDDAALLQPRDDDEIEEIPDEDEDEDDIPSLEPRDDIEEIPDEYQYDGPSFDEEDDIEDISSAANISSLETRDKVKVEEVPGVKDLKAKILDYHVADRLPDVFFTKYPVNLNTANEWGRTRFDEEIGATKDDWRFAVWGRLVDSDWWFNTVQKLKSSMEENNFSEERNKKYVDMLLKNMCQAFGETAHGNVIVLVDDEVAKDNKFDTNAAFGGWELPALTRNDRVDRVIRMDPNRCDQEIREGDVIWERGNDPTKQKPKGKTDNTKPRKHF